MLTISAVLFMNSGKTNNIGNELEKADLIRIESPRPGQEISSPLQILGEARGFWFFEASFPIELQDKNGNVLAIAIATANGEWMTKDFVPFTATLEFTTPISASGRLILKKDNPSGLREHDDTLIVPIKFTLSGECRPTGCSGQVCADKEVITTCEYRSEYACYKESFAVCERQRNGECGWTKNSALQQCLEKVQR